MLLRGLPELGPSDFEDEKEEELLRGSLKLESNDSEQEFPRESRDFEVEEEFLRRSPKLESNDFEQEELPRESRDSGNEEESLRESPRP